MSTVMLGSFARPPWPWLFAAAAIGLVLSAFQAGHATAPALCLSDPIALLTGGGGLEILALVARLEPPLRLVSSWAVMLLAMMPPLLAVPLLHVWRSSRPRRRPRAITAFLAGYVGPWLTAGPPLIALAILLQLLAGDRAFAAAILLALAWSASPWHRLALNRGHRLRRIGLFGLRADRDCAAFGAIHGGWCIASCWAWMLVPLVAGDMHVPAMLAAGSILIAERLSPPGPARWRVPSPVAFLARGSSALLRRSEARHA